MIDNQEIKAFIQNTLGCNCPEDVFQSIEQRANIEIDGLRVALAITVGKRLLVYVIDRYDSERIEELLGILVAAGKRERDHRGLNRVRVVVIAEEGFDKNRVLEKFEEAAGTDEKVHLHVLDEMPHFLQI